MEADEFGNPKFSITVEDHPSLDAALLMVSHGEGNGTDTTGILDWLSVNQEIVNNAPFRVLSNESRCDEVKSKVRDLLRHGGYKPTGRGKPASEYLIKAVTAGNLGHINPVVDLINVVSLHSGLPISVVDLDQCDAVDRTLKIAIAPENSNYVFNASGQTIKVDGLLCLFDSQGACANAVKDSQRTKTSDSTSHSLIIIWGTRELPGQTSKAASWLESLAGQVGLEIRNITGGS